MTTVLLWVIRAYQLLISPLLGPRCRFYPSCSAYGAQALREHGALRGSYLTVRRLLRCHPWNPGGLDFVPARHPATPSASDPRHGPRDACTDPGVQHP